ncbi:MAG TPA: homoserine dehydrogenase [Hyphomicrobiaceae bacterium]|jgi:homoserine dehydrogenase|nr:homoserine dehydrogenase [Hyphomicrobiaceae bacterium]
MSQPLKLGLAGLGTVGGGLVQLFEEHGARLALALGREIKIAGVSARSRHKQRGIKLEGIPWFDAAERLATDPAIDVFVELIGGEEGVARAAVEAALKAGKHVVTANKALLAKHGTELAQLAEAHAVALNFEAAVAGGIPIIKTLREALAGNQIRRVYGILNGTCNYILTQMQEEHRAFAEVLKEAQDKGYAEADPTFDIGGFDTAHKLALLTSLAFGTKVALDQIHVEGIQGISQADIEAADDLGYRIKLLGVALLTDSGIEQRVHPAMVPKHSAIAEVSSVTNCIAIDGDFVGNVLLAGPGAGAKATASAVAGDILDIARGAVAAPFGLPAARLRPYRRAKLGQHQGAYYVRLSVFDRPGAMASIAGRMGERGVSLESIVQRRPRWALPGIDARPKPGAPTTVILITHETTEEAIRAALSAIHADGNVSEPPQMIRIEPL